MKKFFSLVLALVMALSLTTVAWGAGVTSEAELETALAADGEVVLGGSFTVTDGVTVPAGVTVTLDLAGNSVSMAVAASTTSALITNNGTLTIKDSVGGGKLSYSTTTVSTGYSTSTINNNGVLTVVSGTIENTTTASGTGAVYGIDTYGTLTVNGGTISTSKGTAIRQAVFNYDNTVTINGGTIDGAGGGLQTHVFNGNVDITTEINGGSFSGDYAFYTYFYNVIDGSNVDIDVNGGTFDGYVYLYNGNAGSSDYPLDVSISGGTFNDWVGVYTNDASGNDVYSPAISGGTFAVAPEDDNLADGLAAVLVNGEYVLQEPADVSVNESSSSVDTEDWVVVDLTTGTAYDIAEDAEVNKIVYKDIKKTVNGVTTTQYGVTLYGPLTFEGAGAAANGGYAMVVAKESANMQLETAAGKIIFARFITADEYAVYSANEAQYAYTTLVATDYEEKAANPGKCEDVIVSYYVVGDDYYAAATSNADNTLVRYKNEFVIVGEKLDGEPLVPHVFLTDAGTTCKWTVTNNKITSVKCTCGDTFKIVQDIKGLKAGSYVKIAKTLAGETNFAIVSATTSGITSSGSSPSTDKVQSAETFDAGIAMYVGMSVMAAAGSVVVLKKRED